MGAARARSAVHDLLSPYFLSMVCPSLLVNHTHILQRTGRYPPLDSLGPVHTRLVPCASSLPVRLCPGEICRVSGSETQPLAPSGSAAPVWSVSVAAPWRRRSSERGLVDTEMARADPRRAGKVKAFGDRRRSTARGLFVKASSVVK